VVTIRQVASKGRDRVVDLLNQDRRGPVDRRNDQDNRHLSLLLSFGLRSDSNCLDVGAHHGNFLLDFVRLAPQGRHIAYEPVPSLARLLVAKFPTVEVRQRALADKTGESTFVHVLDPELEGYSGLERGFYPREVRTESIVVQTERLDDSLPDGWLPDFVKIDVEGAEQLAFEGALKTLHAAQPVIAFEHGWHGGQDYDRSEPIYRLITDDLGMRLFDMDGHGPLSLQGFYDGLASRWNWIAHP
jgi:FkbM family methyltransferase